MSKNVPAVEGGVPVLKEFLAIGQPDISEAEKREVLDTLSGMWLSKGPKVQLFQEQFARYVNASGALALNSCTAALHLSLIASEIGPGDEVIVPSLTFVATANVVTYVGATPVLVDVDPTTLLISVPAIQRALTPRTRAIIPVHLYGRPCPMQPIMEISNQKKLTIIEDAAHAIGTEENSQKIGGCGDFTCFSFYATKNICTGDGGMVTCNENNQEKLAHMEILSLHGMSTDAWKRFSPAGSHVWGLVEVGYKYNMTDLQASLGIHQLNRLEGFLERRQKLVDHYRNLLRQEKRIQLLAEDPTNGRHAHHLFPILLDNEQLRINRDKFIAALKGENVGCGNHYPALHMQPYYKKTFSLKENDFPVSTKAHHSLITLPLHTKMNLADVELVVAALSKLLKFYSR